jgi:hypothetical protein
MPVISGGIVIEGAQPRSSDPTTEGQAATGVVHVVKASYSFAVDAGAMGSINLLPSAAIPAGAIVLGTLINVITPPTSAAQTATIGIGVEAAADQLTAAVVSGAPWSTAGWKWATQTLTTAPDVTTQARNVFANVAVQALTAGVFDVYVMYMLAA